MYGHGEIPQAAAVARSLAPFDSLIDITQAVQRQAILPSPPQACQSY